MTALRALPLLLVAAGCDHEAPRPPPPQARCPEAMVLVAGGRLHPSTDDGDRPAWLSRPATVQPFCLDRTEATGPDGLPRLMVTWDDAQAACRRRGARLPTEEEWAFAARGPTGSTYPWGEAPPTCAHVNAKGCSGHIDPPGRHPEGSSPLDVQDLIGNAWEWTSSCVRPRGWRALLGVGAGDCDWRVQRGGGFHRSVGELNGSTRGVGKTSGRYDTVGFRCAADLALDVADAGR